jgi:uncharacterized protein (DUF2252 family)
MAVDALTREERVALGKAARAETPRSSHAAWTRGRRRSPLTLLAGQDRQRVPELLPIRYGRMAVSPFTYYRGAALPMASDLAGTPVTGFTVQACGDAHLMNFGLFASPERRLVFDINDFDETLPGPWEWDVKRLAASIEVAGRTNGFTERECRAGVLATVGAYRTAMRDFATRPALDVWYAIADIETVAANYGESLASKQRRKVDATMAKARTKDNLGTLRRFTTLDAGRLRIASDAPLIVRLDELVDTKPLTEALTEVLTQYRETLEPERRVLLERYRLADMARKVVGVGSVGTRCWMLLLLGDDERDPLFLQAKEAGPSVLEQFTSGSEFDNAGRRVVVGQRQMQTVSDICLGWVRVHGIDGGVRDFYVRQLRDWKGGADVDTMKPDGLATYGRLCGWTLARAHARTGDNIAIAAYLGGGTCFDEAIADFAAAYADQTERDHAALRRAIKSGKVTAQSGV